MDSARAGRFPLGSNVRLEDLAANPYRVLQPLREREPVSWIPELQQWFVTKRGDVLDVLRQRDVFTTDSSQSLLRDLFGSHMLSTEGATQARYKRQCFPPFRADAVRDVAAPMIRETADRLIDGFESRGAIELRRAFCGPFAVDVVARSLGFRPDDPLVLRDWYDDFALALANFTHDPAVRERGRQRTQAFRDAVLPCLDLLAATPDGSLLSVLLHASPDRLSNDEILSNAMLILFGGIETTESMLLNTLWCLFAHPEQFDAVLADRSLLTGAIEESLRWETPVQTCTRTVVRATVFRGAAMEAGETVQCMLGAANRDPGHFASPDAFDIRRKNAAEHLSFGFGAHMCLGAALARSEAEVGLGRLFDRLPDLRIVPEQSTSPHGHEFRKPDALCVQWGYRH